VVPAKGHDVLLDALSGIDDLDWRLTCVGSLERDPEWVATLRSDERVVFTGSRVGLDLLSAYASSDLLVLPTRQEGYGMVVTEAQARAIPVVASDVGGVREALGDGGGVLVAADDPADLTRVLRRWLQDERLRSSLRERSRCRRRSLTGWDRTAAVVGAVLEEVAS
jgi:glycosyltransferase involved in cell wall biosynthesis